MSDSVNDMLKGMEECRVKMLSTANRMNVSSTDLGFEMMTAISDHAYQLRGAAQIMQTWIDGIRNETKKGGE